MSDDLRDRIAALLELLRPVTPTEAADAVIRDDGEKRTVIEVTASEVGPSLRWAVAKVEKTSGNGPRTVSQTQNPSGNGDDADPWGTAAHNADDEIPF